jgi:hypothetical protein
MMNLMLEVGISLPNPRVNCFAAAALSSVQIGPPHPKFLLANPCNHPNWYAAWEILESCA